MTYINFVMFMVDFALIQVIESAFIVMMVLMLSKIELNWNKVILVIILCSIAGSIILPFGNYDIANRFEYLIVLGFVICMVNKCSKSQIFKVVVNIFVVIFIMMVIEFISFIPFLFFLGERISTIHENIFLVLILTIPTRILEYLICHLTFIRFGGTHEKIN